VNELLLDIHMTFYFIFVLFVMYACEYTT